MFLSTFYKQETLKFQEIVKCAHSVVVAGGTMRPMEEFRDQVCETSSQSNPQMTSLCFSSSSPSAPLSPGLHPSVAIMLCQAPIFCLLF